MRGLGERLGLPERLEGDADERLGLRESWRAARGDGDLLWKEGER